MLCPNSINLIFSRYSFPEDRIWWHKTIGEIAWKIAAFLPILIFGLYGNFIIIYLVARNRSLRSPTNLILANMAMADFLIILICPIMFMVQDSFQNYLMGCVGCKMEGFLVVLFLITAVLNLSVVSYDRLTAIVLPSEARLTVQSAWIIIGCTWIAGILLALPLALYRSYHVRVWKNFTELYCKENPRILPKYWYVLITILVWLPLAIMLICYTAIFIKLDRYEKRLRRQQSPLTVNYKRSVAKILFIVVIVFAALRLPFTILVVLRHRFSTIDSNLYMFWFISHYLLFLNAAVNPYIYGFKNENFRRAYSQMACVQRRRTIQAAKKHYCWYCAFVKRPGNPQQQTNINSKELKTIPKETYKFYDNADDFLSIPDINSEGFI